MKKGKQKTRNKNQYDRKTMQKKGAFWRFISENRKNRAFLEEVSGGIV